MVTAHGVGLHPAVISLPLIFLLEQESGSLNPVDVHEVVTRLGHRKVLSLALSQPLVEVRHLLELLKDVFNVSDLHTGSLCNFGQLGLLPLLISSLLSVVHGGADFVLLFKNLDLSVFTPDHHFERRFTLKTVL